MIKQSVISIWLVALVLLAGCSNEPPQIKLNGQSTILAFGDSLTQGVGANAQDSYPAVLERQLGVSVVNAGISGQTSSQGLARLEEVLEEHEPDLVILCYGGNDILRKQSMAKLEHNLDEMINIIKSSGSQVLLVGVPKPSLLLSTLPLYDNVAKKHGIIADLESLTDLLGQRDMKSDRVHLNAQGYQALASALSEKIRIEH